MARYRLKAKEVEAEQDGNEWHVTYDHEGQTTRVTMGDMEFFRNYEPFLAPTQADWSCEHCGFHSRHEKHFKDWRCSDCGREVDGPSRREPEPTPAPNPVADGICETCLHQRVCYLNAKDCHFDKCGYTPSLYEARGAPGETIGAVIEQRENQAKTIEALQATMRKLKAERDEAWQSGTKTAEDLAKQRDEAIAERDRTIKLRALEREHQHEQTRAHVALVIQRDEIKEERDELQVKLEKQHAGWQATKEEVKRLRDYPLPSVRQASAGEMEELAWKLDAAREERDTLRESNKVLNAQSARHDQVLGEVIKQRDNAISCRRGPVSRELREERDELQAQAKRDDRRYTECFEKKQQAWIDLTERDETIDKLKAKVEAGEEQIQALKTQLGAQEAKEICWGPTQALDAMHERSALKKEVTGLSAQNKELRAVLDKLKVGTEQADHVIEGKRTEIERLVALLQATSREADLVAGVSRTLRKAIRAALEQYPTPIGKCSGKPEPCPKPPMGSTDASEWAASFMAHLAHNGRACIDEDLMLGWFANAMCAVADQKSKRAEKFESDMDEKIEHLRGELARAQSNEKSLPHNLRETVRDEVDRLLEEKVGEVMGRVATSALFDTKAFGDAVIAEVNSAVHDGSIHNFPKE